jgi:hypothetical protein
MDRKVVLGTQKLCQFAKAGARFLGHTTIYDCQKTFTFFQLSSKLVLFFGEVFFQRNQKYLAISGVILEKSSDQPVEFANVSVIRKSDSVFGISFVKVQGMKIHF